MKKRIRNMKNKKTLSTIAGILFLTWTLFYVVYELKIKAFIISGKLNFWILPEIIASILIAVSCFSSLKILAIVGGAVFGLSNIRLLLGRIKENRYWKGDETLEKAYTLFNFINLLSIAFAIMIILLVLYKGKNIKMIGIITAVIPFLLFLLQTIVYSISLEYPLKQTISLWSLRYLPMAAGTFFLGQSLIPDNTEDVSDPLFDGNISEKLEMLSELKSLLDKSIITKEDFEEKKRVLMGQ